MVKRVLLMLGLLTSVGLVGFVAVLWLTQEPDGPGVTRANCDRIKEGMKKHEVESLLGGPPKTDGLVLFSSDSNREFWEGKYGAISVRFAGDVVESAYWIPNESFLTYCRRWLGL